MFLHWICNVTTIQQNLGPDIAFSLWSPIPCSFVSQHSLLSFLHVKYLQYWISWHHNWQSVAEFFVDWNPLWGRSTLFSKQLPKIRIIVCTSFLSKYECEVDLWYIIVYIYLSGIIQFLLTSVCSSTATDTTHRVWLEIVVIILATPTAFVIITRIPIFI